MSQCDMGQEQLANLNLRHAKTRARVRLLLAGVANQEIFTRHDLDALCGQRNKPLGKLLRSCFLQLPIVVGKRNGEVQLYGKNEDAIHTLTLLIGLVAE